MGIKANYYNIALESIATSIQDIQFPTVTVCPHENSEPDNWAFLEKIFDSIQLDESGAEKVKDEITDKLIEKLYEMLLSKHSSSNDSQFWFENFDTEKFEELFSEASSSVCKKEIDSEDMKIIAVKNFLLTPTQSLQIYILANDLPIGNDLILSI